MSRICRVHDADDPVVGRICGRPYPCRDHGARTRPTTLSEPWVSLAYALGGVAALASACGVTPRTLTRWAAGERTPDELRKRDVRERLRRRGLGSPWAT